MEDNILFKSRVVQDLPTFREFQRGYDHNNIILVLSRAVLILFTLYFCFRIADPVFAVSFFVLLIFWGLIDLVHWLCTRNGNIYYKRQLDNNFGKPLELEYCFTESAILTFSDGKQMPGGILYNQVRYVVETKNLLVLILAHRQGVLVRKETLEGGTQEEFLNFLRRSCVGWKRGKVRKGTAVRVLSWIWAACIVITAVLAICNFPGIEIFDRMNGAVINSMSYAEVAEKLEPLGITGSDETMYEDLEYYYGQYYTGPDYSYYHKSADLLAWVGMGEYDEDTGVWTPSANGVYSPEYEPYTLETMYTDFLRGIDAMNPGELEIMDITEDISRLNQEEWEGTIRLSFTLDGQAHDLELYSPGPWLDADAMLEIANVVNALDENKQLYFADDEGSGLLIFYRDADWAVEFICVTQLPLFEDPNQLYSQDFS